MAILQDSELLAHGRSLIFPFYEEYVQAASIDLHLSNKILVMKKFFDGVIDPTIDNNFHFREVKLHNGFAYFLKPNEFVLASTHEVVDVPNRMVARFEGKSSLGRLGLMTHATAGFIDPGFAGNITLEIKNLTDATWKLFPGMKIGQICFEYLVDRADKPYGSEGLDSRYQGDRGPAMSRIHKNFKIHPDFEGIMTDV